MLRLGLSLKTSLVAVSMVSWSGILIKNTCYIVGMKKFLGNICILDLKNKSKGIFARVIIRN